MTAKELTRNPGEDGPPITRAALYDAAAGEWVRLPDTGQIGDWRWTWTEGDRSVQTWIYTPPVLF